MKKKRTLLWNHHSTITLYYKLSKTFPQQWNERNVLIWNERGQHKCSSVNHFSNLSLGQREDKFLQQITIVPLKF